MPNVLLHFAWLLVIVYSTIPAYWSLVHPLVDLWRARGLGLKAVGPLWLLLWLLAGWLTWPWLHLFLYRTPWAWLPGGLLIATALSFYVRIRGELSVDQVLGRSELEPQKHEQRLVTTGLHARMRHPYYFAHLCSMLGFTVGTGSLPLFALSAFGVLTGIFMVHLEERELERRFGDAYRAYKQRVPILPGLR